MHNLPPRNSAIEASESGGRRNNFLSRMTARAKLSEICIVLSHQQLCRPDQANILMRVLCRKEKDARLTRFGMVYEGTED